MDEVSGLLEEISRGQSAKERRVEFRERCYEHLSKNTAAHRVRLALARLYYLDGYYDFARRELVLLRGQIKNPILSRLLELLGEGRESDQQEEVTLAQITVPSN